MGHTFNFDGMSLAFGKAVQVVPVEDENSQLNGKMVLRVPAFCKNNSDAPRKFSDLAPIYYYQPESGGKQVCSAVFRSDDGLDRFDEIEPGEHIEGAVYLIYKGIGTYNIDFVKSGAHTIVEFDVLP